MSETKSEKKGKKYLPRYRGHSRLMKAGNSGSLSVPAEMMAVLSEGLLFKPELTKDGILFKIVDEDKLVADEKVIPAWVKKVVTNLNETGTIDGNDDDEPPVDTDSDDAIVDEEDDEPPIDEAF